MISQLLIAVIIFKLAQKTSKREELVHMTTEAFPELEVEEFDLEAEFQSRIWTQFVREDENSFFGSTIADSVAVTDFIDRSEEPLTTALNEGSH